MGVLQLVSQLGQALWKLKLMYDQDVDNKVEIEELQSFIRDYDHQIPSLQKCIKEGGGNALAMAVFKNLEKDLMEATNMLEKWTRDKSFLQVFKSSERMQKLGKLHSKVMTCVDQSLGMASVSMLLDLQATQATLLESNVELKSLLITIIGNMHGPLRTKVREEVVQANASSFGDAKFWEDILSAVDNHKGSFSRGEEKNVYEDPITTNLMIDPVVASDGYTYCRWTIIDNNMTRSPFNVGEELAIVVDNLTFRSGLFEKFPEQSHLFRQRRIEYQSCAFSLKAKGLLGDAKLALEHVLQWDKRDAECVEALEEVQGSLKEAQEKYLHGFVGPSNELGNAGPSEMSMHGMVARPPMDLDGPSKLFLDLSSPIPEVQQHSLHVICQWSTGDGKFQKYMMDNGGVRLLALLLPSSDEMTQELALSMLLRLSICMVEDGVDCIDFTDALEPLALVMKEGFAQACEQAARVVFNLTKNTFVGKHIGTHRRMVGALVTSLDCCPLLVQQIVSSTFHNLLTMSKIFPVKETKAEVRKAGLVPLLLGLMARQPTMLEEGLPLIYDLLDPKKVRWGGLGETFCSIQAAAPPCVWVDLVASVAPVHQERAMSLMFSLCLDDPKYHDQVINDQVIEKIRKLVLSSRLIKRLDNLLEMSIWRYFYPDAFISFPEKKWWTPTA